MGCRWAGRQRPASAWGQRQRDPAIETWWYSCTARPGRGAALAGGGGGRGRWVEARPATARCSRGGGPCAGSCGQEAWQHPIPRDPNPCLPCPLSQVIKRANNSPYGLASGVIAKDVNVINKLSRSLKAGTVWVGPPPALCGWTVALFTKLRPGTTERASVACASQAVAHTGKGPGLLLGSCRPLKLPQSDELVMYPRNILHAGQLLQCVRQRHGEAACSWA